MAIDYYLPEAVEKSSIKVEIKDLKGNLIRSLRADTTQGINRVYWDFNHKALPTIPRSGNSSRRRSFGGPAGPMADPGRYQVHLKIGDQVLQQQFNIKDDSRMDISISERKAWTQSRFSIGDLYAMLVKDVKSLTPIKTKMDALKKGW